MKKIYLLILVLVLTQIKMLAQWSTNTAVNNTICTAACSSTGAVMCSDGAGGAIIVWTDSRASCGVIRDLYAQRIDVNGFTQWTGNGVLICAAVGDQYKPTITTDGAGGAIIAWQDNRINVTDHDIFAQRITSAGVLLWGVSGTYVTSQANNQTAPQACPTGTVGEAFVVFSSDFPLGNYDAYIQRMDPLGNTLYGGSGTPICNAAGVQSGMKITNTAVGEAIIAWSDSRSGNYDIYCAKIGGSSWTANGVAIATGTATQANVDIVADGLGGAIVTWQDDRSGNFDIYTQRINSTGLVQWTSNGVAVCTTATSQDIPSIASDGGNGAIITWNDSNLDVFAQRINGSGVVQWTTNGVPVAVVAAQQRNPAVISDGSGGAILTWEDSRGGFFDIYAQRLNSSGVSQWTINGIIVSNAPNDQTFSTSAAPDRSYIISDGVGGAIICWNDLRGGANYDIYAQRISSAGTLCFAPSQPAAITGNTTICSGSLNTYSIAVVSGATSYNWTLPGGWSGTSTTNSINATAGSSGNLTVTATNSCGTSPAQTLNVIVSTAPATPGAISGNITICSGSSNTYSIAGVAGATSYTWVKPGGWTGTSSTNTISTTASSTSGNLTVTATNACGTSAAQTLSVTVNTAPSTPGAISGTNSICANSSNTYSVAAVAGATSYTWIKPGGWTGTSATNIISTTASSTSGNLTVTATNACGTSAAQILSVTVNANPTANAGTTKTITCAANTATLTGSGVSSYTWSGPGIVSGGNTSSPVVNMAGTYSLVGATSGCNSNTSTVIVSTNTVAPSVSVTATSNSICAGSSATLTASGATTYSWSTGSSATSIVVSPTTTTNYILTGTNTANGCSANTTKTITVNALPTVTVGSSSNVICIGNSATLTASGANTYTWNTGPTGTNLVVTPTTSITYTVTGTNSAGCNNTATKSITVNPLPIVSANTSNSLICGPPFQGTATITASGASTYTWNTTATTTAIAVSPSVTTSYTVTGTNANGCMNTTAFTQSVSTCTGLSSLASAKEEINVYPNPFDNKITIIAGGAKQSIIQVYNTLGSLIYSTEIKDEKTEIDLTNVAKGIYFIRINSVTKKIIKE